MSRSVFGWSYPPGCSGPPEYPDPSPESEQVWEMLEAANVDDAVIEAVCKIVDGLAEQAADKSCAACERRAAEAEAEAEKAAAEYWKAAESISMYQATVSLCPHGNDPIDCNPCLIAADLAYDAAREGRYR